VSHRRSRAEKKHIARLERQHKPIISVDTGGIKDGIVSTVAALIAVFVFPFWLMYVQFGEWREMRRRKHEGQG